MRPWAIVLAVPLACANTDDGRSGATTFVTIGPAGDDGDGDAGSSSDGASDESAGSDGGLGTVGAASGGLEAIRPGVVATPAAAAARRRQRTLPASRRICAPTRWRAA